MKLPRRRLYLVVAGIGSTVVPAGTISAHDLAVLHSATGITQSELHRAPMSEDREQKSERNSLGNSFRHFPFLRVSNGSNHEQKSRLRRDFKYSINDRIKHKYGDRGDVEDRAPTEEGLIASIQPDPEWLEVREGGSDTSSRHSDFVNYTSRQGAIKKPWFILLPHNKYLVFWDALRKLVGE